MRPQETFLKSMRRGAVRNAKYSEIRNTIGLFGGEYRSRFEDLVDNSVGEAGIGVLGMAVDTRTKTAPETPPNITFRELEETYVVATTVVDFVGQVLQ